MSAVSHQDAAAPIQPLIAVMVIDRDAFGAMPHQRGLAAHGVGFVLAQLVQNADGIRVRERRADPSIPGFYFGHGAGLDTEFVTHRRGILSHGLTGSDTDNKRGGKKQTNIAENMVLSLRHSSPCASIFGPSQRQHFRLFTGRAPPMLRAR